MNELIKTEALDPSVIFAEGGIEELIETAKKTVQDTPQDMNTAKGRKAIISLAALVTKSKTGVQAVAKEAKADPQKVIDAINDALKIWNREMDALRDETRNPVTEFEQKDEKRKNALKLRMTGMENLANNPGRLPEQMETSLVNLKNLYEHEWQEYSGMANDLYTASKDKIQVSLSNANIQIKKDKELEELREKEKQALKDKEELETLREEKAEREAKKPQPTEIEPDSNQESATVEPELEKDVKPMPGTKAFYDKPPRGYAAGDSSPYDSAESETEDGLADMAGAATPVTVPKQFADTLPESDSLPYTDVNTEQNTRLVFGDVMADMYEAVWEVIKHTQSGQQADESLTEKVVNSIEAKLKLLIDANNVGVRN